MVNGHEMQNQQQDNILTSKKKFQWHYGTLLIARGCKTYNPTKSKTTSLQPSASETGYVQPEWRSNYESDYSEGRSPRPLCSRDLLCWAFQIARGMDYLASRKVGLEHQQMYLKEGKYGLYRYVMLCWAFQVVRGMEYLASRKVKQFGSSADVFEWEEVWVMSTVGRLV